MTEQDIKAFDFFAKEGHRLETMSADNYRLSVENVFSCATGTQFKKLYEEDAALKELVDTARFNQAKLNEDTRKKLLTIYKKKLKEISLRLAEA